MTIIPNGKFLYHMRLEFEKCMKIMESKIHDYNPSGWAFEDVIKDAVKMWPNEPENIAVSRYIYIFMNKHYKAIQRFVFNKSVESEPFDSRVHDMCNFLIIMLVLNEIMTRREEEDDEEFDVIDATDVMPTTKP